MSLDFVAIDVETAASRWDSICSIALVRVRNASIVDTFYTLINPECDFCPINMRINGITPEMTANAPTFRDVYGQIRDFIQFDNLVAHNMAFDGSALLKTCTRYKLDRITRATICTYKLAKYLAAKDIIFPTSFKLDSLCFYYNIPLHHHHNADDDARACALLLIELAKEIKAESIDDISDYCSDASGFISKSSKSPKYPFEPSPLDIWKAGDAFRKEGDFEKALAAYAQAKAAGYDAPALYKSYAMLYHKMKDYSSEIAIIDEFLSGNTHNQADDFIRQKNKAIAALNAQSSVKRPSLTRQASTTPKPEKPNRVYTGRPIIQSNDNGEIIRQYGTIAEAVRETGISSKSIRDAANGIQRHAGGYCWRYADQE